MQQTELLREGRLAEVDIANIAEGIESLGQRGARAGKPLIAHLLKWQFEPRLRGNS